MKKIIVSCLALLMLAGMPVPFMANTKVSANALVDSGKCQASDTVQCVRSCPDPASGAKNIPPECPGSRDCRSVNNNPESCNVVAKYLNPLITALGFLVGVAVVAGVMFGGIQYASSGGDPQKAATGKKHIKMAVIALVGYLFLYAFLAFLIPGGI